MNVNGRISEKTITLPPDLKSPLWQERMFRDETLKEGFSKSFNTWLPELSKVSNLKFRVDQQRQTEMFAGERQLVYKVNVVNSAIPTLKMRGYLDDRGRWVKSNPTSLEKHSTPTRFLKTEALQELAGDELDLAMKTVVRGRRNSRPASTARGHVSNHSRIRQPRRVFRLRARAIHRESG